MKWRGRWQADRTLEHYLQKLGSSSMLAAVPMSTRTKITEYAGQTRALLEQVIMLMAPRRDQLLCEWGGPMTAGTRRPCCAPADFGRALL